MLEQKIEQYLVRQVKKMGGMAYKFSSPGKRSVPDRLCLFPYGIMAFVELKSPTGKLTKLQGREIGKIKSLGHTAVVINSRPRVDAFLKIMRTKMEAKRYEVNEAQRVRSISS